MSVLMQPAPATGPYPFAPRWRAVALVVGGWGALGATYLVQQALATGLTGPMVFRRLLGPFTAAALTPFVAFLARRFPLGAGRTARNAALHAVFGAAISLAALSVIYLLDRAVGALGPIPLWRWLTSTFHEGMIDYAVIVGAVHLLDARRLAREQRARAHQAEARLASGRTLPRALPRPALRRVGMRLRPAAPRPSAETHLMLRLPDRVVLVPPAEIAWVQADGHYVHVHTTAGQRHTVRETLRALEARLGPAGFVRVHRSTLANLHQVRELRPWFAGDSLVLLRDGTELRMSRRCGERLRELLAVRGAPPAP
jgi:LytTr DNA-binding domain